MEIMPEIDFSFSTHDELRNALPSIAELLDTNCDNLRICVWDSRYIYSADTKRKDRIIKTIGYNGLPPIVERKRHLGVGIGNYIGISLHEAYNSNLRYVSFVTKTFENYNAVFFICKIGDLYRLQRHALKLRRGVERTKPILKDGMLESIISHSIEFLSNSRKIEKYGVRIKRGILLDGPPGNGKSMACRYIQQLCDENNIDWGIISASDLEEAFAKGKLDSLFSSYTVSFFDDIDISYLNRKGSGDGKMACALLTAMDGLRDQGHVIRFFTTNEGIENMDDAFVRPGRIDCRYTFTRPDSSLVKRLVLSWPKEIIDNIDLEEAIAGCKGWSFAEIEAIRTNLVTNFVFGNKVWDLKLALNYASEGGGINRKIKGRERKVGFSPRAMASTYNDNDNDWDN